MKRVNISQRVEAFNKACDELAGKSFSYSECLKALIAYGIPKAVTQYAIQFGFIKKTNNGYVLSYISEGQMMKITEEGRKRSSEGNARYRGKHNSIKSAVSMLQSKGYQVRRIIGFNEQKFAKEHPDLYKEYLEYEIV